MLIRAAEKVLKFLAHAILYNESVSPNEVSLALGNFEAEKVELPLDIRDKIALYSLRREIRRGVRRVASEVAVEMHFNPEHVARIFAMAWNRLPGLLRRAEARKLYPHPPP